MLGCAAVVNVPVIYVALTKFAPVICESTPLNVMSAFATTVMLPESIAPEPKFKLVPVATPMFGVTNVRPSLTFNAPDTTAIVELSTLALKLVPINCTPLLAEYEPVPENCVQAIPSVPITISPLVEITQPESLL